MDESAESRFRTRICPLQLGKPVFAVGHGREQIASRWDQACESIPTGGLFPCSSVISGSHVLECSRRSLTPRALLSVRAIAICRAGPVSSRLVGVCDQGS